jgi:hypothetical protein
MIAQQLRARRRALVLVLSLTALALPGAARAQTWEFDRFDPLAQGPLSGQAGWQGIPSPHVENWSGANHALRLNGYGLQVSSSKLVSPQFGGRHVLEFEVLVDNAWLGTPSDAKLELKTDPASPIQDKLFQVFFGNGARVNHYYNLISTPIPVDFNDGQWHRLRFDVRVNAGSFDVYVDGTLVLANLAMQPGPVRGLAVTGFERGSPARVYLDNLLGFRQF